MNFRLLTSAASERPRLALSRVYLRPPTLTPLEPRLAAGLLWDELPDERTLDWLCDGALTVGLDTSARGADADTGEEDGRT